MQLCRGCDMFSGCFNPDSACVSLSFLLVAAVAIHCHPSLVTPRSARDDPGGGRRPAQIPQDDTTQASKESHNLIHNPAAGYRSVSAAVPLIGYRRDRQTHGHRTVTQTLTARSEHRK